MIISTVIVFFIIKVSKKAIFSTPYRCCHARQFFTFAKVLQLSWRTLLQDSTLNRGFLIIRLSRPDWKRLLQLIRMSLKSELIQTSLCCFKTSDTSSSGTYSSLMAWEDECEVPVLNAGTENFSGVFNFCCSSLNSIYWILLAQSYK